MNGSPGGSIQRLKHALGRLNGDPRGGERRKGERRKAALMLLAAGKERRSYGERRRFERRVA